MNNIKLILTSSPYIKSPEDTPLIMRHVSYSLLPVAIAANFYFGISATLIVLSAIAGAVLSEYAVSLVADKKNYRLKDGTAVLTGLLLALTLPPTTPLWMVFLGGIVAILIGKIIFGGTGSNIFNPALVGRAFLQASFPVALTTWSQNYNFSNIFSFQSSTFNLPFLHKAVDGISTATPLSELKFEGKIAAFSDLFLGNISGSLGETSALLLLIGGAYLALRNFLNWRIPLSIFTSVYIFAGIFYLINPAQYAPPHFHIFSGGLMLGAIFMATDPVSSPITQRGCILFGFGIGLLVVIIRLFGGLPEGVMYAILIMNGVTPLINRVTHPRIYGEVKQSKN